MMNDVALFVSENGRARAYIDLLAKNNMLPVTAVVLDVPQAVIAPVTPSKTPLFDNITPIKESLSSRGVEILAVQAETLNDCEVVELIKSLDQSYIIFAGPAGALLRKPFFELGKKFIHVHPGKLPEYRGSTSIYYSLINEGSITATAFIMSEDIDAGTILLEKNFPLPGDLRDIDLSYDPYIRAKVLVEVMTYYCRYGQLPCTSSFSELRCPETYYIIHPVLKHVALLMNS